MDDAEIENIQMKLVLEASHRLCDLTQILLERTERIEKRQTRLISEVRTTAGALTDLMKYPQLDPQTFQMLKKISEGTD